MASPSEPPSPATPSPGTPSQGTPSPDASPAPPGSAAPQGRQGPQAPADQSRERSIVRIMRGEVNGPAAAMLRGVLSAMRPGYGAVVTLRNKAFDCGVKRSVTLPRPVISVGNVTTGGTGKTPFVMELLRRLLDMGRRPAVLMRGYRAAEATGGQGATEASRALSGGDEAAVYRAAFGDRVPIGVNPDRVAGSKAVLENHAEVDVFVLDDGFQHRRVSRDLNIVLIDASTWPNERLLPRGFLREPKSALKRADLLVLTHVEPASDSAHDAAPPPRPTGLKLPPHLPVLSAEHAWTGYLSATGETLPIDHLAGQRVLGVCGIGKPAAFARQLRQHTCEASSLDAREDHAGYEKTSLLETLQHAANDGYAAVVTTEKDWVKWSPLLTSAKLEDVELPLPVLRAQLGMVIRDADGVLDKALAGVFDEGS